MKKFRYLTCFVPAYNAGSTKQYSGKKIFHAIFNVK